MNTFVQSAKSSNSTGSVIIRSLLRRSVVSSLPGRYSSTCSIANRIVLATTENFCGNVGTLYQKTQNTTSSVRYMMTYVSPFQDIFDRMHRNEPSSISVLADVFKNEASNIRPRKILKCGIPEDVLRFSSTSYGRTLMAPTVHPNEHSVVLKVNTMHLPLNDLEMDILREIVGPRRFNPERSELRLTSNQFGSRIENKRHLVTMLDRIILSCQRLGQEIQKDNNSSNDTRKADDNKHPEQPQPEASS